MSMVLVQCKLVITTISVLSQVVITVTLRDFVHLVSPVVHNAPRMPIVVLQEDAQYVQMVFAIVLHLANAWIGVSLMVIAKTNNNVVIVETASVFLIVAKFVKVMFSADSLVAVASIVWMVFANLEVAYLNVDLIKTVFRVDIAPSATMQSVLQFVVGLVKMIQNVQELIQTVGDASRANAL